MQRTKVAVIEETNRRTASKLALEEFSDELIEKTKSAKTILLKVNLVHHANEKAVTHIDTVRGILDVLHMHSPANIFIGDASYTSTKRALEHYGYAQLLEEYPGVQLVDLQDDETVEQTITLSSGQNVVVRQSKLATDADVRISVQGMKVDTDHGTSLSIKNWVYGTWIVPHRNSVEGRVYARWPFIAMLAPAEQHELMAKLYQLIPIHFSLVDGQQIMEGEGPIDGTVLQLGVTLAGFDAIAVDAVAASLMGIDPHDIGYLSKLQESQAGTIELTHLDIPPMQIHEMTVHAALPMAARHALSAWKGDGRI
ncbi:MAG: DUF362 domain-containing protein [bacterium]|nr:DUF362 domain-containing protein [bacterium]MDA1024599.1 DUF362 domain-containing protein [bacterium]